MMKIDPVGGAGAVPSSQHTTQTQRDNPKQPTDTAELGQSPQTAGNRKPATYSLAQITAAAGGDHTIGENRMTSDARASKLAAIEKRVGEGAYNAREIIERVADRLLEEWGLGTRTSQPQSE